MKVGQKGQVVIPKAIRNELGIRPGDSVPVERRRGEVVVSRAVSIDQLVGILGPPDGMADWEGHKWEERQLEERRWRRYEEWSRSTRGR